MLRTLTTARRLLQLLCLALWADQVFAWGVGTHILVGKALLQNLPLLAPLAAEVIWRFSRDFLYGSIAPDIFIGKGELARDRGCHAWEMGFDVLGEARSRSEKAFALGFLSHLAADIVCHNYYVPNQIYTTGTSRKLGHLYSEAVADQELDPVYVQTARGLARRRHLTKDLLMMRALDKRKIPFGARRRMFTEVLAISQIGAYRKAVVAVSRRARFAVDGGRLLAARELSLAASLSILSDLGSSPLLAFDPTGRNNIRMACRLHKESRRGPRPLQKRHVFGPPPFLEGPLRSKIEGASLPAELDSTRHALAFG